MRQLLAVASAVVLGATTVALGGLPHPRFGDLADSDGYEARLTCDAGGARVRLVVNGEPRAPLPVDVVRCASDRAGACRFVWDDCASERACDRSFVVVAPGSELALAESDATVVFECRRGAAGRAPHATF